MGPRWWCSLFLLGIRLVAYGHLASHSLLSATSSKTNSPIIPLVRRLSIQRSPGDLWSCRCLKGLPAHGAIQDARSEKRATDGAIPVRVGHSHTPNEQGQSVPRQYLKTWKSKPAAENSVSTVFWRSIFCPPLLPPGMPALAPPAMPAPTLSHVSCAFPSGHGSDRHACGRLLRSRPRPRVVIRCSPPDASRHSYGIAVARPFRTASAPPRVVVQRSPPHACRRPLQ